MFGTRCCRRNACAHAVLRAVGGRLGGAAYLVHARGLTRARLRREAAAHPLRSSQPSPVALALQRVGVAAAAAMLL